MFLPALPPWQCLPMSCHVLSAASFKLYTYLSNSRRLIWLGGPSWIITKKKAQHNTEFVALQCRIFSRFQMGGAERKGLEIGIVCQRISVLMLISKFNTTTYPSLFLFPLRSWGANDARGRCVRVRARARSSEAERGWNWLDSVNHRLLCGVGFLCN